MPVQNSTQLCVSHIAIGVNYHNAWVKVTIASEGYVVICCQTDL